MMITKNVAFLLVQKYVRKKIKIKENGVVPIFLVLIFNFLGAFVSSKLAIFTISIKVLFFNNQYVQFLNKTNTFHFEGDIFNFWRTSAEKAQNWKKLFKITLRSNVHIYFPR
jgi:hypothetical protein